MPNYDFTSSLSPIDFELLSQDLLQAELGIRLENFRAGKDQGIDLRFSPSASDAHLLSLLRLLPGRRPELIVQAKRHSNFNVLKSELVRKELPKIQKLNPARYILTTSVSLSPQNAEELKTLLNPFIHSTDDIFGRDRLNSLLRKHEDIERQHLKLWLSSTGVLESILNAKNHIVSREEVERALAASKIYVRNQSFDEALRILDEQHVCIISGQPGIGKTTLARMLLLYFHARSFDIVKIESDISEARSVRYHERPRFYYYDDFLGQTAQSDKLNKNEDQKLLDFMRMIRDSRDSRFVLTTREYILNQAQLHYEKLDRERFDHRTCIIDLSKYTRRMKAQILYNHLHFSNLPKEYVKALIDARGYVTIVDHRNYNPRLIEFLTSLDWVGNVGANEYFNFFQSKLENPRELWEHAFRNQISANARDLLLSLTTLPAEVILEDLAYSLTGLLGKHEIRSDGAAIVQMVKRALKELEGTFITTRNLQGCVLVKFQNASIRDFLKNILLQGEFLSEILIHLVFFEQAQWLAEIRKESSKTQHRVTELDAHENSIGESLKRLFDAQSCSFSVDERSGCVQRYTDSEVTRLQTFLWTMDVSKHREWLANKVALLAEKLESGVVDSAYCVVAVGTLRDCGLLLTDEGQRLAKAIKDDAVDVVSDIDQFERLSKVIKALPEAFSEAEVSAFATSYEALLERYMEEFYLDDPEELRQEASRIGDIGDILRVNTDQQQERLTEAAEQIENENSEENERDDDDSRSSCSAESCSDGELDSMFGTLSH